MHWQFIHSDLLLERLHHHIPVSIRILMFLLFQGVKAHFLGIARTKFKKRELLASHRHLELHTIKLSIRQKRHYNLLGEISELALYLSDKCT